MAVIDPAVERVLLAKGLEVHDPVTAEGRTGIDDPFLQGGGGRDDLEDRAGWPLTAGSTLEHGL